MNFINSIVQDISETLPDNLLVIPVLLFLSLVVYFTANIILKRIERSSDHFVLRNIRKRLKSPTLVILLLISLLSGISVVQESPEDFSGLKHLLFLVLIGSLAWLAIKFVKAARMIVLSRYDVSEKDNLKARKVNTQFLIIERILIFIIVLLAIAISLMTFDSIQRIGVSLFASAGIAGIILGFAAQKILASVLAGFQLAITQPIRLDDVVIVENEWGWIEEITLTYVVVRIWDKRRLVVPTTYFIEKPFQNWTRVSADLLGTVFIYTDYRVPFDELRKELTRLLEGNKLWDGQVNVLQVTNATQSVVEIRALLSTADSPSGWDLRVYVREKLIEFIQNNYPESLPRTRIELPSMPHSMQNPQQQPGQ